MPDAAVAEPPAPSNAEASSSIDAASRSAAAMGAPPSRSGIIGEGMADAFSKIKVKAGVQEPPKQTPPPKPAEQQKPTEQKQEQQKPKEEPAKPAETTKEKVDEKPSPTDQTTAPGKAKKPSDYLREEMQKWKDKATQYESELKRAKETPAEHPEVKTLSEKLAATEKRAKELDDIVRTTAYERHDDFKKNFDQPFLDSYAAGAAKVKALKIVSADGSERAGDLKDWEYITGSPSEDVAADRIEELFGTGVRANMVSQHYMDSVAKFRSKQNALTEAQKTAADRHAQFQELQGKLAKEVAKLWQESSKHEAVPDQWKPYIVPKGNDKDGKAIDPEWDAALTKGYERYDRAMSEDARQPNLSPEQRKDMIGRAAAQRHQAAAFRPLVSLTRKQDKQIKELQAELEAYRKTEPGPGEGEGKADAANGQPAANTMAGVLAQIRTKAGQPVFH